jgi:hypothetical protein
MVLVLDNIRLELVVLVVDVLIGVASLDLMVLIKD